MTDSIKTTDLVARLRIARGWSEKDDLMADAADEIEHLRTRVRRLETEVRSLLSADSLYELERAKGLARLAMETTP